MPLSEHEQRLLADMERALYAEDPKFASALRGADLRAHYRRRVLLAAVGFLVGIALLVTGQVSHVLALSVAGFVVMLATVFLALTSWRAIPGARDSASHPQSTPSTGRGRRPGRRPKSSGGMMERLEQRWNRRREENGR